MTSKTLILACEALAGEMRAVYSTLGDEAPEIESLPIEFHWRPKGIPDEIRRRALSAQQRGVERVLVGYGDCGTFGALDGVCQELGLTRLEGEWCFMTYLGRETYDKFQDEEAGTWYMTDFFVRNFETLVWRMIGLDNPVVLDGYFGHYRRVIYLAQSQDSQLSARAEECALRLGLAYERVYTGRDRLKHHPAE